jgi:hypothetical protein
MRLPPKGHYPKTLRQKDRSVKCFKFSFKDLKLWRAVAAGLGETKLLNYPPKVQARIFSSWSFQKFSYRDAEQGIKRSNIFILRVFMTPLCALEPDL